MNQTMPMKSARAAALPPGGNRAPSPILTRIHPHGLVALWLAAVCALACLPGRARAQSQPDRFLFIYETSPVLKKNLPLIRDTVDGLFAGNLQNEIKTGDDLAIWTVDQAVHTGAFPLQSWSSDDAAATAEKLDDFMRHQHYTKHANLEAIQPLLNRVAHNSERLTVLIFCDSQSQLTGTPYDSGVNGILTNATARLHGEQVPFILVLRAYHGQYLGCSVNRSGVLNFPPFPQPPAPAPAPFVKTVMVTVPSPSSAPSSALESAPAKPATGPVVAPVPALIIVGTNAGTNVSLLSQAPPPAPAPRPQATNLVAAPVTPPAAPAPETTPAAPVAVNPPRVPTPVTPPPAVPAHVVPSPVAATPPPAVPVATPPPAEPAATAVGAAKTEPTPPDTGYFVPLVLGGGALIVAIALVVGFVVRARRPRGSLITSSMQDDPRRPPRS
jgi:hypothetical protein